MNIVVADEPLRPRPNPRRSRGKRRLLQGAFLSIHLAMLGGVLAYFQAGQGRPSPPTASSARTPEVKPEPPTARPAPARAPIIVQAPALAPKARPRAVSPPPDAGPGPGPATRAASLAESRGISREEAPAPSPEDLLGEKGLRPSGGKWLLLDGEDQAKGQLAKINAAAVAAGAAIARLAMIRQMEIQIARLAALRNEAALDVENLRIVLDATPHRGNNLIVANFREIRQRWLARRADHNQCKREIEVLHGQMPGPPERNRLAADRGRLVEAFRAEVTELRRQADTLTSRYDELSKDDAVAGAIRQGGGAAKGATIGPSDWFKEMLLGLADAEKVASRN